MSRIPTRLGGILAIVLHGAGALLSQQAPATASAEQLLSAAGEQQELALAHAGAGRASQAADAFLEAAGLFGRAGDALAEAKCLHNGGAMLSEAGRHAEAATVFGQAYASSAQLGQLSYVASSALGRGFALGALGREDAAQATFAIAAELFDELGDRRQQALALHNGGVSLANLSRWAAAAEAYERAETIDQLLGDLRSAVHSASGAAQVLQSGERVAESYAAFDRAIRYLNELGLLNELGADDWLGELHHERGVVLIRLNRYEDALADFDAGERLLLAGGNALELAWLAYHRGQTLMSLGLYDESSVAYDVADERNRTHDVELTGSVLQGRGELLCRSGRFTEGLELFAEVAEIMRPLGSDRLAGNIAGRQAEACRSLGHFGRALRFLVEAESAFRRFGRAGLIGTAVLDRAELYAEVGRMDASMAAYREALALFTSIDDSEWIALTEVSRSMTLRKAGEPELAMAALERAWPALKAIGNERQLISLRFDRVSLLRALGDPEGAAAELDDLEAAFVSQGGLSRAAQFAMTRAAVDRALGRTAEALAGYDRAEALWEELAIPQHLIRLAVQRGDLLGEQGRHAEALASYERATDRIEGLVSGHVAALGERSSSSMRLEFAPLVPAVLDCIAALPTSGDAELAAAWRVLEVFCGLGMAQLVAERGAAAADELPPGRVRALAAARRAVNEATEQLADLTHGDAPQRADPVPQRDPALAAARATLVDRRQQLERLRDESRVAAPRPALPPVASMEQVLAALRPDEAFVHYAALGDRVHALVVSRSGARLVTLGSTVRVDDAVDRVARRLDPGRRRHEPVPLELAADLRALGRLVLDPILAGVPIDTLQRLFVVPSGSLCRVPFEALLTADVDPDADPTVWPYLVRDISLAYVHSGTTWLALSRRAAERRPSGPPRYVALAHPDYEASAAGGDAAGMLFDALRGGRTPAPLPRTADEVLAVARLLAASEADDATLDRLADALLLGQLDDLGPIVGDDFLLLLRDEATEDQLHRPEIASARIVHLACHATADTRAPGLSHLVLGRSARSDGRVFVDELAELDLSCELLVLSACETNAGPVRPLEGVAGLSRAGLVAGAGAVLSTLWQVQDDGARRLIVDFHRAWLTAGHSRITALGQAKRAAVALGVPVSTWSAFVLWDGASPR